MLVFLSLVTLLLFCTVPLPRTWKAPAYDDARPAVYEALAEFFLDTQLDGRQHAFVARRLAASPYDERAIEAILRDEVAPVVSSNLLSMAGVWSGFDPTWLVRECQQRAHARRAPWTSSLFGRWLLRMVLVELRTQSFPILRRLRAGPDVHMAGLAGTEAEMIAALAAIRFLHEHGRAASDVVAKLLEHDLASVRGQALAAYTAIAGHDRVSYAVRRALDDEDATVRVAALKRLGISEDALDEHTRWALTASLERSLRGATDERLLAAEAWLRLRLEPPDRARELFIAGLVSETELPDDRWFEIFTRLHIRPAQVEAYLTRTLSAPRDHAIRRRAAHGAFRWLGRFAGNPVADDDAVAARLRAVAIHVLREVGS